MTSTPLASVEREIVMIKDRVLELFKDYDKDVQRVIERVLDFEQENISIERARIRFMEPIREIIDRTGKK